MARILIVDDEFALAELLGELLELRGHSAVIAINGVSALGLLNSSEFDLVISDIMMPVMTGPEMIASMRETPRLATIPVILTSAEPKLLVQTAAQGVAQATINKPFGPAVLYAHIDRLLPRRESNG